MAQITTLAGDQAKKNCSALKGKTHNQKYLESCPKLWWTTENKIGGIDTPQFNINSNS